MEAFLQERIGFPEMGEVVSEALDRLGVSTVESLEHVLGGGSGGPDRQRRADPPPRREGIEKKS